MIHVFDRHQGSFRTVGVDALSSLSPGFVWIDLENPSREEEMRLEALTGLNLPTAEEMRDIEPSSRLYAEGGAIFMTANLVHDAEREVPAVSPVTFVVSGQMLITIRYCRPRVFTTFPSYAERNPDACRDGTHALVHLLESVVDRAAEVLEMAGTDADRIATEIFATGGPGMIPAATPGRPRLRRRRTKPRDEASLRQLLARIARTQNLVSKVRDSLVSLGRLAGFFIASEPADLTPVRLEHLRSVQRDVQSLTDHASYIFANTSFLLEAALGLISLEQNAIIKIFSIASVTFLPPTLVASVYGMNFRVMPELSWPWGYGFAVALMVISAALPFIYFKRRGWL